MEDLLLTYLKEAHTGRTRRITGTELGRRVELSDTELRKRVNRLRQKGVPICADRSGYFYAANAAEVYATIRQLEQMAGGLLAAMEGLERAMEQFQDGSIMPDTASPLNRTESPEQACQGTAGPPRGLPRGEEERLPGNFTGKHRAPGKQRAWRDDE